MRVETEVSLLVSLTDAMKLTSYLVKNRYGVFYLRLQRDGKEWRRSLRTKDPSHASAVAYRFGATIHHMSDRHDYLVKLPNGTVIKTDGTEEDHARAMEVLQAANLEQQKQSALNELRAMLAQQATAPLPNLKSICIRDAVKDYEPQIKGAAKSIKMAKSTLSQLVTAMGADFDMSKFNDETVEAKWMVPRRKEVAGSTVKKELSWIRGFSTWAANDSRKFCPAPLSLTVPDQEAKNVHREYFRAEDLKRIFDELPSAAKRPWHFWLPVIGLYTGARIGEPAALRVDHFFEKAGIKVMHLPGTKTDCAPRDIPIHPDLITLGLLDLVEARKSAGKQYLFDITWSAQNGAGAAPSKWFGLFLRNKVGVSDKNKVFHSFRHTIIDHLRQHDSPVEARMQYVGHSSGQGSHGMYGREPIGLQALKDRVVNKIDWQKYCGWSPNLATLLAAAKSLNK